MNLKHLSDADIALLHDDFENTPRKELINLLLELAPDEVVKSWLDYIKEQTKEDL